MENIFEGAKFGDKFITRDGRIAIYIGFRNSYFPREKRWVRVLQFISEDYYNYDDNPHYVRTIEYDERFPEECNIVSKYQEQIDEGELTELSLEDVPNYCYEQDGDFLKDTWIEGFKAGYRKAKED